MLAGCVHSRTRVDDRSGTLETGDLTRSRRRDDRRARRAGSIRAPAKLVQVDHSPTGHPCGSRHRSTALDTNGDGAADIEFVQFACDDGGNAVAERDRDVRRGLAADNAGALRANARGPVPELLLMDRRELLAAERGTLFKEAETRIALVYPSPYRAAMSSLGYQQIYRTLHGMPGVAADRAMLPDGAKRGRFETLETGAAGRQLSDARVLGRVRARDRRASSRRSSARASRRCATSATTATRS